MALPHLKKAIFAELRKSDDEVASHDDDSMNRLVFHHQDGLRLSYSGFLLVKKVFTAYSFSIPEDIKSRHRQGMDKMEFPYFFTKSRLILFSDMDAMTIRLYGSVEQFLETCYHIDR